MKIKHEHNTTATERAVAIIVKNNKILIFHRIKDGEEYYAFPGGSVEDGETREEAVVRELKEEMCIDIKIDKFLFSFYVPQNRYDHGRTSYYYLVTKFTGNPELGESEKERHAQGDQFFIHWMSIKDIAKTNNLYTKKERDQLLEHLNIN